MGDSTAHKADNYVRFTPLCTDFQFWDGVFWAVKWELRIDRKEAIDIRSDQWVQPDSSVHLAALWICGRTAAEMEDDSPVQRIWKPELEANPETIVKSKFGGS